MAAPTLTVIMSNYNHGRYLHDSLSAICEQSRVPDEVLVYDDCSTDDSRDIISEFAARYSFVQARFNAVNIGGLANCNRALDVARGEWVHFASADDRILPGFLERSLAAGAIAGDVGMVVSDPVWLDEDSGQSATTVLPFGNRERRVAPDELSKAFLQRPLLIPGHSALYRRGAVEAAGRFPEAMAWHADWFVNLVIAFREGIYYLPEALSAKRVLLNSWGSVGRADPARRTRAIDSIARHLSTPAFADVQMAFRSSAALSVFGLDSLRTAVGEPAHRWLLTPTFVRRCLVDLAKACIRPYLPGAIRRWRQLASQRRIASQRPPTSV